MEVILKEDVLKLGRAGDKVKVADGYGRNFLLPKQLAVVATPANKKRLEQELNSKKGQAKRVERDAEYLAETIQSKPVVIKIAAGEGGKLFGSVTTADIEKELAKRNIVVDKRKIEMEDAIKTLGSYEVVIKVHADVTAKLTVIVEDEKAAAAVETATETKVVVKSAKKEIEVVTEVVAQDNESIATEEPAAE